MQKWHYFVIVFASLLFLNCSDSDWDKQFLVVRHELDIQIEPEQQAVFAKDRIFIHLQSPKTMITLLLDPQFEVDSVFFQGRGIKYRLKSNSSKRLSTPPPERLKEFEEPQSLSFRLETIKLEVSVEIFYHGNIKQLSQEQVAKIRKIQNQIVIALPGEKAVLVSNCYWYPRQSESLAQYQIAILTPQNFEAIAVGKLVSRLKHESGARLTVYEELNPVPPISLFSGIYSYTSMNYGGCEMFSCFFPNTEGWAERYFDTATHALDLFHQKIGNYPYEKFAIVSSPIPVSQAFPSFCIIDSAQIQKRSTAKEVVNHFVCQNWWGQAVFAQPETGDWTEGLVTYLADYYEQESVTVERAADARYFYLREYFLKVPPAAERPLSQCLDLVDSVQFVISQSKGTMFFHQLRKKLGETIFYDALQEIFKKSRGQYISWVDLQNYFEKASQTRLDSLFDAWVNQIEPIQLELKNVKSIGKRRNYTVSAEISATNINQADNNININVPLLLQTQRDATKRMIPIRAGHAQFKKNLNAPPVALQLDPDFDIFRRLTPAEVQPFIGEVLKSHQKIVVLPGKIQTDALRAYRQVVSSFNTSETEPVVKFDNQVSDEELKNYDLVLFGGILENQITNRIRHAMPADIQLEYDCFVYEDVKYWKPTHALVASLRSPFNPQKSILLYWGIRSEAIASSADEVEDLQNYGFIILRDGLKVTWRQWRVSQGPLYHSFN